jgi:hypothetical protein
MNPIDDALLAVMASIAGDATAAHDHLEVARQHSQAAARRHRQVLEIASLVVSGAHERAAGLALVHASEFPRDAELLAQITRNHATCEAHR